MRALYELECISGRLARTLGEVEQQQRRHSAVHAVVGDELVADAPRHGTQREEDGRAGQAAHSLCDVCEPLRVVLLLQLRAAGQRVRQQQHAHARVAHAHVRARALLVELADRRARMEQQPAQQLAAVVRPGVARDGRQRALLAHGQRAHKRARERDAHAGPRRQRLALWRGAAHVQPQRLGRALERLECDGVAARLGGLREQAQLHRRGRLGGRLAQAEPILARHGERRAGGPEARAHVRDDALRRARAVVLGKGAEVPAVHEQLGEGAHVKAVRELALDRRVHLDQADAVGEQLERRRLQLGLELLAVPCGRRSGRAGGARVSSDRRGVRSSRTAASPHHGAVNATSASGVLDSVSLKLALVPCCKLAAACSRQKAIASMVAPI